MCARTVSQKIHTRTHAHTDVRARAHTHTHARTRTHSHTHIHTLYKHTHTHTRTHTRTHDTHTHTHRQTYTLTTYTHTHTTHTYTHTHTPLPKHASWTKRKQVYTRRQQAAKPTGNVCLKAFALSGDTGPGCSTTTYQPTYGQGSRNSASLVSIPQTQPRCTDVPDWVTTSAAQTHLLRDSDSFNCKCQMVAMQLAPDRCHSGGGSVWDVPVQPTF